MRTSVSIIKYCGIFALVYAGLMFAMGMLSKAFDFNSSVSVNTGMLIAGAWVGTAAFLQDHRRSPNKHERRRLMGGSLAASVIVSLVGFYVTASFAGRDPILIFTEIVREITPVIFAVAVVIVMVGYYTILGLCYWWFGLIAAKVFRHEI
ncbi:MAG: ABZJ_00895 family protein [Alphaproteobacteria bacterium]|nr:ABZJ_00895 family protein [Alphaproteobacteria bacterium]